MEEIYGKNVEKTENSSRDFQFSKFPICKKIFDDFFSRFFSKLRSSDIFPSNCSVIGKCKQSANLKIHVLKIYVHMSIKFKEDASIGHTWPCSTV